MCGSNDRFSEYQSGKFGISAHNLVTNDIIKASTCIVVFPLYWKMNDKYIHSVSTSWCKEA